MDDFLPFPLHKNKAKFCPHLKYATMDKQKFQEFITPLMHYSSLKDRLTLRSQRRACEHCQAEVKDQRIECQAYRLGTAAAYFKHVCKSCNFVLFDGSMVRDAGRRPRPTEPQVVKASTKGMPRSKTKPVQTPAGQFPSLTDTAAYYKKSPSGMLGIMRKNPKEYYYLEAFERPRDKTI